MSTLVARTHTHLVGFSAADWAADNRILAPHEVSINSDDGLMKKGDGATAWSSLGYFGGGKIGSPLVTTPVATVSVSEYGNGRDMVTILTLTDFVVGALAGAGAALGLGNIVAAFPAGAHIETAYYANLSLKAAGTAVVAKTGLGSVIAAGVISVLSGTATFQDRLTAQDITTDPAGGTAVAALKTATAGVLSGIALNVAASIKNIFLNAAGTWNANNTGNLTATGTIVVKWTKMGA
jgi:hypothetical protein